RLLCGSALDGQIAPAEGELSEVTAALANPAAAASGAQASAILGTTVADGQAQGTLQARPSVLTAAIKDLEGQRAKVSDGSFDPAFLAQVDELRALADIQRTNFAGLEDAKVAVTTAQSTVSTSYSFSGGVTGTWLGRIAIV